MFEAGQIVSGFLTQNIFLDRIWIQVGSELSNSLGPDTDSAKCLDSDSVNPNPKHSVNVKLYPD
jgi:hypothetical protein